MSTTTTKEQAALALETAANNFESKAWGWTQGVIARDANGNPTLQLDPAACSFCTLGALHKAALKANSTEAGHMILRALQRAIKRPAVAVWNDTPGRTVEEVIAAMRLAAKHLRGQA